MAEDGFSVLKAEACRTYNRPMSLVLHQIKRVSPRMVTDYWQIAEAELLNSPVGYPIVTTLSSVIRAPDATYFADPIDLVGNNDSFLVEQFDVKLRRGRISELNWKDDQWLFREHSIDTTHHVSFPFSFDVDGQTLLSLECSALPYSALWVNGESDSDWREAKKIWNEPLADVTITLSNDRWLLMAARISGPSSRLTMMMADQPTGPWAPIEFRSPDSARSCRPGGRPIVVSDGLLVPLQQMERGYGSSVGWYHFEPVTQSLSLVSEIHPPTPFVGLHTVAHSGTKTLVDLRQYRLRTHAPRRLVNRHR